MWMFLPICKICTTFINVLFLMMTWWFPHTDLFKNEVMPLWHGTLRVFPSLPSGCTSWLSIYILLPPLGLILTLYHTQCLNIYCSSWPCILAHLSDMVAHPIPTVISCHTYSFEFYCSFCHCILAHLSSIKTFTSCHTETWDAMWLKQLSI